MRTIDHPIVARVVKLARASGKAFGASLKTGGGYFLIGYDPGDRCTRDATVLMRRNDDGTFTIVDERVGEAA